MSAIIDIMGPRRCGKTELARAIAKLLQDQGVRVFVATEARAGTPAPGGVIVREVIDPDRRSVHLSGPDVVRGTGQVVRVKTVTRDLVRRFMAGQRPGGR